MALNASEEARESLNSRYRLWCIWVVWLPFMIPCIINLLQTNPSLLRLIVSLTGVALFVAIYLWATFWNTRYLIDAAAIPRYSDPTFWLPFLALIALSVVLALLNNGPGDQWLTPFIFTSSYAGSYRPSIRNLWKIAIVALFVIVIGWFTDHNWLDLWSPIFFVVVVGGIVTTIMRAVLTSRELRVAREEVARLAVMTERLRIARDLHDLLGHNLSLIALKSELAGRLLKIAPERAATEIGDVEHVARTTLQEVREAVTSYRQPTLASELHAAREILAAAGIAYHYQGDANVREALPTVTEAVLSWTIREGVTNIIRHSHAHQCTIHVKREKKTVSIELIDDGGDASAPLAAQLDATASGATAREGNGLRGLAERVEALGGQFYAGHDDGGFRLAISVPLGQKDPSAEMPAASTNWRPATAPVAQPLMSGERSEQR